MAQAFLSAIASLLLAGVLLVAIIASVLVPAGVFDSISTTIDLNQVELPKKYLERTLPSISIDGKTYGQCDNIGKPCTRVARAGPRDPKADLPAESSG